MKYFLLSTIFASFQSLVKQKAICLDIKKTLYFIFLRIRSKTGTQFSIFSKKCFVVLKQKFQKNNYFYCFLHVSRYAIALSARIGVNARKRARLSARERQLRRKTIAILSHIVANRLSCRGFIRSLR